MPLPFMTELLLITFFMLFVFFISQIIRDTSIVDIAWGLGFIIVALFSFSQFEVFSQRRVLITLLTVLWGLRLAMYIFIRRKGRGEDYRYADLRKKWGGSFAIQSLFKVFFLQGGLLFIIAFPIMLVNYSPVSSPLSFFDYFGLSLWCFGFTFESLADLQKFQFKKNPDNKDKVIDFGLWAYSRHPNYFGEFLIWWGIFFIALSSELGYFSIISPILITALLLYVSGVPLLERRLMKNPEYIKYMETTPQFFPKVTSLN